MHDIEKLISRAEKLPPIPQSAASEYFNLLPSMIVDVDENLAGQHNISALIGENPLQIMYDNHKHHAYFMAAVFSINSYSLLARTIPWVYRSYSNHNFSFDYFSLELQAWLKTAKEHLSEKSFLPIQKVYRWMIDEHEATIAIAKSQQPLTLPVDLDWLENKQAFRTALLEGDHQKGLELAENLVQNATDLENFYLQILQPAMYEIGTLWENAEISVATEHLASAVARRVMVALNLKIQPQGTYCGHILVCAAPNEYHEIGPSMICDMLENNGWKVTYLGANVPEKDLVESLDNFQPDILAISVTIPFNISKAKNIIDTIRADSSKDKIYLVVGGIAFNNNPGLWEKIGADAHAANLSEMRTLTNEWLARKDE